MSSKAIAKPRVSLLGSQSLSPLTKVAVGSRVVISRRRGGWVRYVGKLTHESGEWYGVALDEPKGDGDGTWGADRYFDCAPNHGVFVRRKEIYSVVDLSSPLKDPPSPVTDENSSNSSASTDLQSGEGEVGTAAVQSGNTASATVASTTSPLLQPFKSFRKHLDFIALKASGSRSPANDSLPAAANSAATSEASSPATSPTGKSRLKPPSPLRRIASFSQGLPERGSSSSLESTLTDVDEKRRLSSPPASPKSSHAKLSAGSRTSSSRSPPGGEKQLPVPASRTSRMMPPSPSTPDRTQSFRMMPRNRGALDGSKLGAKNSQADAPSALSSTSVKRIDSFKVSSSDVGRMKPPSPASPDRTQSFRVITGEPSPADEAKRGTKKFPESTLSALSPTQERRTSSLRAPSPIHKPPSSENSQGKPGKDTASTWLRRFSSYKAPPATNTAATESSSEVKTAISAPVASSAAIGSPSSSTELPSTHSEALDSRHDCNSATPAQCVLEDPPVKCAASFEAQVIGVDLQIDGSAEEAQVQSTQPTPMPTESVPSERLASFKIPATESRARAEEKNESTPIVPLLNLPPSSSPSWVRTGSSTTADGTSPRSHDNHVQDAKGSPDNPKSFEEHIVDLDLCLGGDVSEDLAPATPPGPPESRLASPEPAEGCESTAPPSEPVESKCEENDIKPLLIPPEKSSPARAASFRALRIDVADARTRSLQLKPPSPPRVASFRSGDYFLGLLVSDASEASPPSSPRSTTASSVGDAGDTDTQSEASAVSAPEPRGLRQPPRSPRLQLEHTTVESLSPNRHSGELDSSPSKRPLFFRRANVGCATMERRSSCGSLTSVGNGTSTSPPRSPTSGSGSASTRASRVAALEKEIDAMRSSHENVVAVLRATNKQHAANVLELRAQAAALSEANLWLERQLTAKSELVRELRELEQQQHRDHVSVGEVEKILELKDAQIQTLEREVAQLRQKLTRLEADKDAQLDAQLRHFAARRERDEERVQELRQEVVAMCNDRVALQNELRDLKEMTHAFF